MNTRPSAPRIVRHRLPVATWVRRAREGDSAAWKVIAQCIRKTVVQRMGLSAQVDREEVVADTVSEVWRSLHMLRRDEKIIPFARTIARRIAHKIERDRKRYLPLFSEPWVPSIGARNADGEELLASLKRGLRGADEELFRLLYVTGASATEVQSRLGISARVFRQRKHRLHRRLRRALWAWRV